MTFKQLNRTLVSLIIMLLVLIAFIEFNVTITQIIFWLVGVPTTIVTITMVIIAVKSLKSP